LAVSEKGREYLGGIKKKTGITIVTKPAGMRGNETFEKNMFIDNICKLALFDTDSEINEIKQKPYLNF